jgi:hypothetical protein
MTTCQICDYDYSEFHKHCPVCGAFDGRAIDLRLGFYVLIPAQDTRVRCISRAYGAEPVIPHCYPLHVYAAARRSAGAES